MAADELLILQLGWVAGLRATTYAPQTTVARASGSQTSEEIARVLVSIRVALRTPFPPFVTPDTPPDEDPVTGDSDTPDREPAKGRVPTPLSVRFGAPAGVGARSAPW
jgi:hypothetical protein